MAPRLRKMKNYRPRRKRAQVSIDLQKQALHDLKHKISSDVGCLIVLYEEGNQTQITQAQAKAKSDFHKHSDEMVKIAKTLGDSTVRAVREYLDSVDLIVHAGSPWLDDAKIRNCFTMTEKLEKEIAA